MNTLKPVVFLFPVIALILVSLLFTYSKRKATDKKLFNKFVFFITMLAFLLNFTWEILQMPLYDSSSFSINHILYCAIGAIADTIMVLLLYFGFTVIFKNIYWIELLKWEQISILVLTGGIGAILSEIRHLSLGNWAYSDSMPIIPFFNVGLSPILQFMVLPALIYSLSFYCLKTTSNK